MTEAGLHVEVRDYRHLAVHELYRHVLQTGKVATTPRQEVHQ